ncbi:MAG: tetratricopeptide repeat protein [Holophagales bacterium]|nr:tetratricopeptide repeat protein [Holophagales bacterium]
MTSGDAYARLRSALKSELQRNFGRIGEIETKLSRSEGYLSKFCRGDISIPVEILLRSLELLDRDPGQFFNQAFRASSDPMSILRYLAEGASDKGLGELEKAAASMACELEDISSDPSAVICAPVDPTPEKTRRLVESTLECSKIEQRRRLRTAKRYRNPHFVKAYLRDLINVSYDDPKTAVKQAELVGTELVPLLRDTPARERLELILRAIFLTVSCQRLQGRFPEAAAGAISGIALGRRFRLDSILGELLKLGAYVLNDHGFFEPAQRLLGEALVLFDELDDEISVAKVQVQRGLTYVHLGDNLSASRALRKALRRLPDEDPILRRYRLAAFQNLSKAFENAGDLDTAEDYLREALDGFRNEGGIVLAKLLWARGRLACLRGELREALDHLEEAYDLLIRSDAAETALISLEISRVLLQLGHLEKARDLARCMAQLLKQLDKNKVAQATLVQYIRTAVEAELTLETVDRCKRLLEEALGRVALAA